jgi:hypothetical protein
MATNKKDEKKEVKSYVPRSNLERNAKIQAKTTKRALLRLEMIDQCCKKLHLKRSELQKLVGTLNIARMSDIINDIYLDSKWFKYRKSTHEFNASKKPREILATSSPSIINEGRNNSNMSMDNKASKN